MNKNVQRELLQYQDDDELKFSIDVEDDDVNKLRVTLSPPEGTPYEDGIFFLEITIPPTYPSSPPDIIFITKIYHPNIDENGKICLEQLKSEWKSTYTLRNAIDFIYYLLEHPNWETPLVPQIGAEYKANPKEFERKARDYTNQYAV